MRRVGYLRGQLHRCAVVRTGIFSRQRYSFQLVNYFHNGPPCRSTSEEPEVKARIWEQAKPGSSELVDVTSDEYETDEEKALLAKIKGLERELQILKTDPLRSDSPLVRALSKQDRETLAEITQGMDPEELRMEEKEEEEEMLLPSDEEVESYFREEFGSFEDGAEEAVQELGLEAGSEEKTAYATTSQRRLKDFEVELRVPAEHQAYAEKFNRVLRKVAANPEDKKSVRDLWIWYRRAKQTVHSFRASLPPKAWELLWSSQSRLPLTDQHRYNHLRILTEDMHRSQVALSPDQTIVYLDGLIASNQIDLAASMWRSSRHLFQNVGHQARRYWETGVAIMLSKQDLHGAEELVDQLALAGSDSSNAIKAIFQAWCSSADDRKAEKAWSFYLKLKTLRNEAMTMEDYDSISNIFIDAGMIDLALGVFKDLMLHGKKSGHDSIMLYKASLRLAGELQASSITESQVNKVSIEAFTVLPRKYQNKFFFGSWIKKLIGMGRVDSAAAVVDLMSKRGVKPDAKHLNGIIGAWLRSESDESELRAEKMAWSMIHQRLRFVRNRKSSVAQSFDQNAGLDLQASGGLTDAGHTIVPPATSETFSLLVFYYSGLGKHEAITQLTECMALAEIAPTAFYMNQLLYAELRRSRYIEVWKRFLKLSEEVQPDIGTFACLWNCAKIQIDRPDLATAIDFPSPQKLYGVMSNWAISLSPKARHRAAADFQRDLYEQIIRCFCLTQDFEGAIVAMHSLKANFQMYPSSDTARYMMLHVSRLSDFKPRLTKADRRRLAARPDGKGNISKVSKVMEALVEQKELQLTQHGRSVLDLTDAEQKEFQLGLLTDFLWAIAGRLAADPNSVADKMLLTAARMGAEDLDLGASVTL